MSATLATVDVGTFSRVEKLAALLVILGPESAGEILKGFSHDEIAGISAAMAAMPPLDHASQRAILREFSGLAVTVSTTVRGGADVARHTLERALGETQARQFMGRVSPALGDAAPMHAVAGKEPLQLFKALKDEQPQTIALVLSFLDPKKATMVLNKLDDDVRDHVIERVATLGPAPSAVVDTVAKLVLRKMGTTTVFEFNQTGGVTPAATLLKTLGKDSSNILLAAIENRNPELGQTLRKEMFRFEDIARFDTADLQKILREVDPKTLATALKPASDAVKSKILAGLSKRAAESLEEEIGFLGKVKPKEIDACQMAVIDLVRRLESDGAIEMPGEATES